MKEEKQMLAQWRFNLILHLFKETTHNSFLEKKRNWTQGVGKPLTSETYWGPKCIWCLKEKFRTNKFLVLFVGCYQCKQATGSAQASSKTQLEKWFHSSNRKDCSAHVKTKTNSVIHYEIWSRPVPIRSINPLKVFLEYIFSYSHELKIWGREK